MQRRRDFDKEHPKRIRKAKASDDPLEKVRDFIRYLKWYRSVAHTPTVKPDKLLPTQRIVERWIFLTVPTTEEITRLEKLIGPALA
jgi:hypothetical protein